MPFYRRPEKPTLKVPDPSSSNDPTAKWILYAIVFVAVAWLLHGYYHRVPKAPNGVMANDSPQQVMLDAGVVKSFYVHGYKITPIAKYEIKARVLSVRQYSDDREADLSPVDFALGWSRMSDSALLSEIEITQHGRWYYWRYANKLPVSDAYIIEHSGNMHIIPATAEVAKIVESVKENNFISLRGYLVSVSAKDGYTWNSSTSREDTGAGSCEVMWVEAISIK